MSNALPIEETSSQHSSQNAPQARSIIISNAGVFDRYFLAIARRIIALSDQIGISLGKRRTAPTGHPYRDIDPRQMWARCYLSWRYIRGKGLEIGALHSPLPLFHGARSTYVDYMSLAEIRKHYPELEGFQIAEPDIVDNAEHLTKVSASSQAYLVANHFIEHCENPIGTISNLLSKLKIGGKLFLAVPMRDATFDRSRDLTTAEHILADYRNGPEHSRWSHYCDWAQHVAHAPSDQIEKVAKELLDQKYSIHYHVWNFRTFRELLELMISELEFPMRIVSATEWRYNPFESVYVLEKTA